MDDRPSSTTGGTPSHEYQIKDLPTRSVTLYPARAHVVRDINNVVLQPGANEIVIHGITPTADEHSVQIDGKGAATITDITVELVPNREIFEEAYPELEEPEDDDDDDQTDDEPEDPEEVQKLTKDIDELKSELKEATEVVNSAQRGLETLDSYCKTLRAEKSTTEDLTKTLEVYERQRSKIFARHREASSKVDSFQKSIAEKEKAREKAWIPERKRREKEEAAKEKALKKKRRQKHEQYKERHRLREEKLKFWPIKVYRVVVSLEAVSDIDTPASSRRGSVDSVTLSRGYAPETKARDPLDKGGETTVSLSLSYVTKEASWTPRYDLNLSSVNKVATIAYRAEFFNATSETWRDAQLVLSTSQTSYQGLEDKVPFMHPWHVRLGKWQDQGLLSPEELDKPKYGNTSIAPMTNRHELFGSSQSTVYHGSSIQKNMQKMQAQQVQKPTGAQQQAISYASSHGYLAPPPPPAPRSAALFGANNNSNSNTFSNVQVDRAEAIQAPAGSSFGGFGRKKAARAMAAPNRDESPIDSEVEVGGFSLEQTPGFDFEESEWDDNGLTSTYEVPGHRTLAPSSLTRRHKIATLNAANIHMSHIAVPKLRASAFLRAKIRNPSSTVTLLKGVAGLTLDGAFLGNTMLSRVSPGQLFDLSLGVDPAVHISYPKPSVHRSTQGLFTKESDQIFSRSVWVTNTKPVAIELLVLDQVPVSGDERLRIDILHPRGLSKEGDVVRTGSAAKQGASGATSTAPAGKNGEAWGKATAALKKDGKVDWTVNVEKKQACLLRLEYEAKMPASENIVPV